jgi:hypothetical protein
MLHARDGRSNSESCRGRHRRKPALQIICTKLIPASSTHKLLAMFCPTRASLPMRYLRGPGAIKNGAWGWNRSTSDGSGRNLSLSGESVEPLSKDCRLGCAPHARSRPSNGSDALLFDDLGRPNGIRRLAPCFAYTPARPEQPTQGARGHRSGTWPDAIIAKSAACAAAPFELRQSRKP